jgi:hypothetical protein
VLFDTANNQTPDGCYEHWGTPMAFTSHKGGLRQNHALSTYIEAL